MYCNTVLLYNVKTARDWMNKFKNNWLLLGPSEQLVKYFSIFPLFIKLFSKVSEWDNKVVSRIKWVTNLSCNPTYIEALISFSYFYFSSEYVREEVIALLFVVFVSFFNQVALEVSTNLYKFISLYVGLCSFFYSCNILKCWDT